MAEQTTKLLTILSFAAIYLIWGTTYLVILIGLEDFPPHMMASIRFVVAGVILVSTCMLRGEKIPAGKTIFKNTILGISSFPAAREY